MYTKALVIFVLIYISSSSAAIDLCTKDKAYEIAMNHLRNSNMYLEKYEPYKLFDNTTLNSSWGVYGIGGVSEMMRGGGSPTVEISPETCEIINAYYAR